MYFGNNRDDALITMACPTGGAPNIELRIEPEQPVIAPGETLIFVCDLVAVHKR